MAWSARRHFYAPYAQQLLDDDAKTPTRWLTAWERYHDPGYPTDNSERTKVTSATRLETRRRHHVRF
eukprot:gene12993-9292_t